MEHRAKVIASSPGVTLEQLEAVLGPSEYREHSFGSLRRNGTALQQSIWMRTWAHEADRLEELAEEVIAWLREHFELVRALAPESLLKVVCYLPGTRDEYSFVVSPQMSEHLAEMQALLAIETVRPRHAASAP